MGRPSACDCRCGGDDPPAPPVIDNGGTVSFANVTRVDTDAHTIAPGDIAITGSDWSTILWYGYVVAEVGEVLTFEHILSPMEVDADGNAVLACPGGFQGEWYIRESPGTIDAVGKDVATARGPVSSPLVFTVPTGGMEIFFTARFCL
jgi:hypothetical protein